MATNEMQNGCGSSIEAVLTSNQKRRRVKRRLKQAGLPAHYSPHSFRATGITNFLENDGTLEAAQRIAGHADSRTTKLYDRRGQKVLLEDMERNAKLGISLQMSSTLKCGVN